MRTQAVGPVVRVVLVVQDEEAGYMFLMRGGRLSMGGFHGKKMIVQAVRIVADGSTGPRIFSEVSKSMARVNLLMGMGITNRVVCICSTMAMR